MQKLERCSFIVPPMLCRDRLEFRHLQIGSFIDIFQDLIVSTFFYQIVNVADITFLPHLGWLTVF